MIRPTATQRQASPARTVIGGNLVRNGRFRLFPTTGVATTSTRKWLDGTSGGSSTDSSYGWATGGSANVNASASFDLDTIYNGHPTLHLSTTAAGQAVNVYNVGPYDNLTAIRTFGIKLPADFFQSTYNLTYVMKTVVVSGAAATGARVGVAQWNGGGGLQGSPVNAGVITTTDWTSYTVPLTLNTSGARYAEIVAEIRGSDGAATLIMDAWIAEISFSRREPVTRSWA